MATEEFVYKLTSEGIDYGLVHYFSAEDIEKEVQDEELRIALIEARHALIRVDDILENRYSECIA